MSVLVKLLNERLAEKDERIRELKEEVRRYNASIVAHHNLDTLSKDAIVESIGGPCQICARAQAALRAES